LSVVHLIASGSGGFGSTSTFGAQPASGGLFGGAASNQTSAAGGIFGGGATSVFGQTQQQQQPAATFCKFRGNCLLLEFSTFLLSDNMPLFDELKFAWS